MSGAVRVDVNGAVATLTLDRASKRNALTGVMLDDLDAAAGRIETDRSIRAAVITGAGGTFCTGADINEWSVLDPVDFARLWIARGHRILDRLARLPVPLIGAIDGACLGGGLELAACCDVRVASPDAVFGLPETGVGVTAGWSGLQRLGRLMPEAILREMALTGARLDAERMQALGFLSVVDADPSRHAACIAARASTLSPRAVETTKRVIEAASGEGAAAAVDALAGALIGATGDKAEGVAAFTARRKPTFPDG